MSPSFQLTSSLEHQASLSIYTRTQENQGGCQGLGFINSEPADGSPPLRHPLAGLPLLVQARLMAY